MVSSVSHDLEDTVRYRGNDTLFGSTSDRSTGVVLILEYSIPSPLVVLLTMLLLMFSVTLLKDISIPLTILLLITVLWMKNPSFSSVDLIPFIVDVTVTLYRDGKILCP